MDRYSPDYNRDQGSIDWRDRARRSLMELGQSIEQIHSESLNANATIVYQTSEFGLAQLRADQQLRQLNGTEIEKLAEDRALRIVQIFETLPSSLSPEHSYSCKIKILFRAMTKVLIG
jgi:hypothetical protein